MKEPSKFTLQFQYYLDTKTIERHNEKKNCISASMVNVDTHTYKWNSKISPNDR